MKSTLFSYAYIFNEVKTVDSENIKNFILINAKMNLILSGDFLLF